MFLYDGISSFSCVFVLGFGSLCIMLEVFKYINILVGDLFIEFCRIVWEVNGCF